MQQALSIELICKRRTNIYISQLNKLNDRWIKG